ncbi:MAG: LpxD N-terminal domain-containing protein, partial [Planctomycetota bacterium]
MTSPMTLDELATRIGATVAGDGSKTVSGCAPIQSAGPDEITFLANPVYAKFLDETKAAAVIVGPDIACPNALDRLVSDDPYFAFRNALIELYGYRKHPEPMGATSEGTAPRISGQATVHPSATI